VTDNLTGRRLLITSGPTWAAIDAVRYIGNRSSGRLGSCIAREALGRGAAVTVVAGPGSVTPACEGLTLQERARLRIVRIESVPDLIEAVEAELTGPQPPDAVVHAMAVLDYVPAQPSVAKTPSGREEWQVRLVRTPKVIRIIRDKAPGACLVEFKLEVDRTEEQLREAALASLRANGADLVVANDLNRIDADRHPALILAPDGTVLARPGTKAEIAAALCDILAGR
jgi:phosphopantothenoylcysteine synthetase/decarboxylase